MRYIALLFLLTCAINKQIIAQVDSSHANNQFTASPFPFNLNLKTDLIISGTAGLCWGGTLFTTPQPLNITSLAALDTNNLIPLDRYPFSVDSAEAADWVIISDVANLASFGAPLVVGLLLLSEKNEALTYAVMYAEGFTLTYGVTQLLKEAVSRPRPYAYQDNYPIEYRLSKDEWASFPSAHTSSAAFNCFFAAYMLDKMILDKQADEKLRIAIWAAAAALPAYTGFARVSAARHFPTDVAAGYVLGAGLGLLIPYLHEHKAQGIAMTPLFSNEYLGASIVIQR